MILAVIISAMFPFAAFAEEYDTPAEDVIIEEYQYTQSAVAGSSISSKNANCSCLVTGYSGKATKITVTLELQKKNGTSWNSIYARGKTVNGRTASYSYTYNSLSSGKNEYANSTYKTYNFLKDTYIPPNASYAKMKSGINSACTKICDKNIYTASIYNSDLSLENVKKTWGNVYYKIRNNKTPVIILTQDEPTYHNHWATCYGVIIYYTTKGKVKLRQYVVDDSMGRNNIKIRCQYVDGFMYLN